ncbi:MAG: 50S ribosomal protein L5 [Acidobacteria bacterium]|nr:50S ribosomal protein L5 [Acidobacteriota bacterium]
MATTTRLKQKYQDEVIPALQQEYNYSSPMAIPKIAYVKLNMGLGEAISNSRLIDAAVDEMAALSGQKPVVTKARKSIAQFKLREGMPIGCCVTLRGDRMYEFLDRLISIALPRVRDFRGIAPKAFDGRGNYTLGVREHVIFPEIDFTKVDKIKGMNVTIVTTAKTDPEAFSLLRAMGMPFRQ